MNSSLVRKFACQRDGPACAYSLVKQKPKSLHGSDELFRPVPWSTLQRNLTVVFILFQRTFLTMDKRHMCIIKPRRPLMTNAHALLDGTEASWQGHASERPIACFSTRRSFDHHGKGNSKKEFRKNEKEWNLFVSLIDLIATKTLLIARLPVTVSNLQPWSKACLKKFSPGRHTATVIHFYFGSVQFSVKRKFAVSVRRKFR